MPSRRAEERRTNAEDSLQTALCMHIMKMMMRRRMGMRCGMGDWGLWNGAKEKTPCEDGRPKTEDERQPPSRNRFTSSAKYSLQQICIGQQRRGGACVLGRGIGKAKDECAPPLLVFPSLSLTASFCLSLSPFVGMTCRVQCGQHFVQFS